MIYLILWFIAGIISASALAYQVWCEGDIKLGDLFNLLIVIFFGPVVSTILLLCSINTEFVILKGKKK